MDEKIDLGLFARLMRLAAPARKDLLEYIGQGPVASESVRRVVNAGIVTAVLAYSPAEPSRSGMAGSSTDGRSQGADPRD